MAITRFTRTYVLPGPETCQAELKVIGSEAFVEELIKIYDTIYPEKLAEMQLIVAPPNVQVISERCKGCGQ